MEGRRGDRGDSKSLSVELVDSIHWIPTKIPCMELELKNPNLKHNLQANGWKEDTKTGDSKSLSVELVDN